MGWRCKRGFHLARDLDGPAEGERTERRSSPQVVRSESWGTPAFRGWKKRGTSKGTK